MTLRAVARGAGITPSAIYPHFDTPDAILLAVVQDRFGELHDHLRAAVGAAAGEPVAALRAWCAAYLGFAAERPERYLIMFGGVWNARPAIDDDAVPYADVAGLGLALLDDLAGLIRDHRPQAGGWERDATVLWVALHGLAHQRIVSSAYAWPAGVEERLLALLVPA